MRDTASDLLKGVAGLLMVQVHVMELLAQPALGNSWRAWLGAAALVSCWSGCRARGSGHRVEVAC